VFIQETIKIGDANSSYGNFDVGAFGDMRLLGVYQGAWDGRPGEILAADRELRGDQRVPLGMGLVVPIGKVIELIKGSEKLKRYRERMKPSRAAKTDDAFSSTHPANDENPKH
jgi:hypothetical protein